MRQSRLILLPNAMSSFGKILSGIARRTYTFADASAA
jgi:hypothetical protein